MLTPGRTLNNDSEQDTKVNDFWIFDYSTAVCLIYRYETRSGSIFHFPTRVAEAAEPVLIK